MTEPLVISASTCLGCGCTCDDIDVVVQQSAIIEVRNACALGAQWFGTGDAPSRARINDREVSLNEALDHAASILSRAIRPRVLLGPDLSCEAYREAVACADLLHARLDSTAASATTATLLAIQEHGIATATLGEIRNRADVVIFWGVDPGVRFPRYESRYAPGPAGVHVPDGRRSRRVIAVDVGDECGPADADARVPVDRGAEVDIMIALAALLSGAATPDNSARNHVAWRTARTLVGHIREGRYVALVAEATVPAGGDQSRIHRLLAVSHALNVTGRGALSLLRDGGNQSGGEAVMTRQTGYPAAVDYSTGVPRYRPHSLAAGAADAMLVVGATKVPFPPDLGYGDIPSVIIGPRASQNRSKQTGVVIDSGTAGIHTAGTGVRMDDVAVPLKRLVAGPPDAANICADLRRRLQQVRV